MSVPTDEVKETDPVGDVVAPAAVLVTETVTVTGWPTSAVGLENPTELDVVSVVTVRFALPFEVWWTASPEYVAVIWYEPAGDAETFAAQLD